MQMDGEESSNVEDRRGAGGGFGGGGMGGMGIPIGGGGLFRGGLGLVAVVVMALVFGVDPMSLLGMGGGSSPSGYSNTAPPQAARQAPANDPQTQFVSRVLKSTEDVWGEIFQKAGKQYRQPRLVLFHDATQTSCGAGQAAMGPFYCPPDERVYIDLAFFDELATRFRAPGQFPEAYVIAHEVGHHVQNLLGISTKVQQMRESMSKRDGNAISVRTELQADCFAGVWAYHANQLRHGTMIGDGDVDQALAAATAIGDDRLQRQTQGRVVPDSFTHGTSAQRVRWFRTGLEGGDMNRCDTFRAQQL